MSDIVIAKLITGEIIVGKKTETHIKDCIQVRIVPKTPQNVEIAMAPMFPMLSDDFVDVPLENIVTSPAKPAKDLEKKYMESVSNLIIPGSTLSTTRRM